MTPSPVIERAHKLRPALVAWLYWIVMTSALDTWAFGFRPDLVQSGAYTWATSFLSTTSWSFVMGASVVGAAVALGTHNHNIARATLVVHAMYHIVFGASILLLTLNGTVSAVIGTTKWWALAFGNLLFLSLPSLRIERETCDA